jgi:hypothetical protein
MRLDDNELHLCVCVCVCDGDRDRDLWPECEGVRVCPTSTFEHFIFWFLSNMVWIYAISITLIRVLLNIRKLIKISSRTLALEKLSYSRGKTISRAKSKVETSLKIMPNCVYPGRLRSLRITLFHFYFIVIYLALYETKFLHLNK